MYALLITATILFASQFLFSQQYQKTKGAGFNASLTFTCCAAPISFLIMIILNGFKLEFSVFSALVALWASLNGMLYSFCSLKAFSSANLSVYSIFAMLGGMLLPFFYGIVFADEPLTVTKILCCVLIFISLTLTSQKGKSKKTALFFYLAVFILNGMSGIIAKIHQSNPTCVDSRSFIAIQNIISFVLCSAIYIIKNKEYIRVTAKELTFTTGYTVCCSLGNLFTLIALTVLPASVQYPIITGGVMVFSTVISILRKEKPGIKNIISAVIAVIASTIIIL